MPKEASSVDAAQLWAQARNWTEVWVLAAVLAGVLVGSAVGLFPLPYVRWRIGFLILGALVARRWRRERPADEWEALDAAYKRGRWQAAWFVVPWCVLVLLLLN